jgi:tetratricopeptide (TPR) repeat protein
MVEAEKAIDIFPDFQALRKVIIQGLLRKGVYNEALEQVRRARADITGAPARLDLLAFCEARLGNEAEARHVLAELEDWQKRGFDVNEELGFAHVGLRQYDQAVEAFERFVATGILWRSTLRNPLLQHELREHPRFQSLLRKLEDKASQHPKKTQTANTTEDPAVGVVH